jgi:hypothetical protein
MNEAHRMRSAVNTTSEDRASRLENGGNWKGGKGEGCDEQVMVETTKNFAELHVDQVEPTRDHRSLHHHWVAHSIGVVDVAYAIIAWTHSLRYLGWHSRII